MGFWGRRLAALAGGFLVLTAAAPVAAEPALWKVQGPHATVYLFGTIHLLKPTTQWRSPKIDAAFAASTTLWEEISNPDDAAAATALVQTYGLDAAHPLSSRLDDAAKAKLASFETRYGVPDAQVQTLRPWFAGINFSIIPIVKAGYAPGSGVDVLLKNEAHAKGKPMHGFETIEEQLKFFADLPPKLETDFMLSVLDDADAGPERLDRMVSAWAAGDTAQMEDLLNGTMLTRYPELYQLLLAQRNRRFANKIEELLKGDGVVFVAVGAGHLLGPDSVQADLARDGIKVARE
jgi:hypothetical protein